MNEETPVKILVPEVKDRTLKEALERLTQTAEKRLKEQSEILELKQVLIKAESKPEQQYFAFFPIELMRTSIFFPYSDKNVAQKNLMQEITVQHSWGELKIKGVKLAIFQEDTLLKLLTEKENAIECKTDKHSGFKVTYKLSHLAKGINQKSGANKRDKKRTLDTLQDFQLVNFLIKRKIPSESKKQTYEYYSVGNIISSWHYNEDTGILDVYFNPQFWNLFGEGMLAGIDINKRQKLKGDCSKALLRFIQAHKKPTQLNLYTVMQALNYEINQPASKLATILKKGIKELINIGELNKKSKITKNYIVFLEYPETNHTKKINSPIRG
ncbi:MAG: hypothetical protein ACD_79C00988G0001 [uncultured bacterium]|nr:MAG: hypothetical protein ACD_79C00988G0001 [uncultured bacterium]